MTIYQGVISIERQGSGQRHNVMKTAIPKSPLFQNQYRHFATTAIVFVLVIFVATAPAHAGSTSFGFNYLCGAGPCPQATSFSMSTFSPLARASPSTTTTPSILSERCASSSNFSPTAKPAARPGQNKALDSFGAFDFTYNGLGKLKA